MRRFFLVYILLGLSVSTGFAQDRLQLDEEAWRRNSEKLEYTPEEKPEVKERKEADPITDSAMPDLSAFKYVAYAIVVLVIVALLILILRNVRPEREIEQTRIEARSIEEAEDNLPMVALTKIYQEALDAADYKRALRIKFLMVLQSMIDAQMIVWKKRKTNEQYLLEIQDAGILGMFREAVRLFDDVWYGEAQLSAVQYNGMIEGLDQLNAKIHGGQEG